METSANTLPPIFVSGTGRSGTWLLYKCLERHHAVHVFPREMRFLVDMDGLRTLVDALTDQYHPVYAGEAVYRFERLMRVYLTTPESAPYRGFALADWLGGDYYWQRLAAFCDELVEHEFAARTWQLTPNHEGRLVSFARRLQRLRQQLTHQSVQATPLTLEREHLYVARYFPRRDVLAQHAGSFISDLFGHAAAAHGRQTWCEKTPQSLLHLDFIWEMLPQSVVVHMKRDPRGVLHSLRKQPWAPTDLEGAVAWLRNIYERWFDLKSRLELGQRPYLEVSLEDFCVDPRAILGQICDLARLENRFEELPAISLQKVDYWKQEMSEGELRQANRLLGSFIERLGYEV